MGTGELCACVNVFAWPGSMTEWVANQLVGKSKIMENIFKRTNRVVVIYCCFFLLFMLVFVGY